jgi:hypothetical protein
MEIGQENPDIFFTDREGRRNTECLSWGVDKELVLRGRTGIEVFGRSWLFFFSFLNIIWYLESISSHVAATRLT